MSEIEIKLSDLIGKTIESCRYTYVAENNWGLQEFHAYIKLSNGLIFDFPVYDDEVFLVSNEETRSYFQKVFDKAEVFPLKVRKQIEGEQIVALYFSYDDEELDDDRRAWIKLSNGLCITEENYGPAGLNNIDLHILSAEAFEKRCKSKSKDIRLYTA